MDNSKGELIMLKKTITYTDYDGNERKEDFFFNLTKAELIELQLGETGGMQNVINSIIRTQDTKRLLEIFKKVIVTAYGEKSVDGKRFIKNKELTDAFTQTEAYSELFMEMISDDKAAAAFINGILPSEISSQMDDETTKKALADAGLNIEKN